MVGHRSIALILSGMVLAQARPLLIPPNVGVSAQEIACVMQGLGPVSADSMPDPSGSPSQLFCDDDNDGAAVPSKNNNIGIASAIVDDGDDDNGEDSNTSNDNINDYEDDINEGNDSNGDDSLGNDNDSNGDDDTENNGDNDDSTGGDSDVYQGDGAVIIRRRAIKDSSRPGSLYGRHFRSNEKERGKGSDLWLRGNINPSTRFQYFPISSHKEEYITTQLSTGKAKNTIKQGDLSDNRHTISVLDNPEENLEPWNDNIGERTTYTNTKQIKLVDDKSINSARSKRDVRDNFKTPPHEIKILENLQVPKGAISPKVYHHRPYPVALTKGNGLTDNS